MKINYSLYSLTPKRKANSLGSLTKKTGVNLRGELNGKIFYADFFSHPELGDETLDEFMESFRFQKTEFQKKVFDLLLKDHAFQNIRPQMFKNHALQTETTLHAPIKYKIMHEEDYGFLPLLERRRTFRLDANGIFTRSGFESYIKNLDPRLLKSIQYVEDPTKELDWENLPIKTARDFVNGSPADFIIHKPNARFKSDEALPHIFSSYMGGALGVFHAYCELINEGDLSLYHGINTFGVYEEDRELFTGVDLLTPHVENIRRIYRDLGNQTWKSLGTI